MRLPAALLLSCVSAFCQFQPPSPEGAFRPGNGVTSPSLIARTDPQYSPEAKIAKMSGKVQVSLVVRERRDAARYPRGRITGSGFARESD
jgi:hypothetical protein